MGEALGGPHLTVWLRWMTTVWSSNGCQATQPRKTCLPTCSEYVVATQPNPNQTKPMLPSSQLTIDRAIQPALHQVLPNHSVAAVYVAKDNAWLIKEYRRRGAYVKRIMDAHDAIAKRRGQGRGTKSTERKAQKLHDKIKQVEPRHYHASPRVACQPCSHRHTHTHSHSHLTLRAD